MNPQAIPLDTLKNIFSTLLATVNKTIEHYEALKRAIVMKDSWTVENGFMTPSLKIKRIEVEKAHAQKYMRWYKHDDIVLWE